MYDKFVRQPVKLASITLDPQNPRIVTLKPLNNEQEIVDYFFEHEDLGAFIKKIVDEDINPGAETPFIVKTGTGYTVVEGNTRVAAYKLLAGLIKPSKAHQSLVPNIPAVLKNKLQVIECSIAPSRDALLPIMANAHFGLGDKSKWGYLGSRKAVYTEWKNGRSVSDLAKIFNQQKGKIRDFILEYELYLEALKFSWTKDEREKLEDPSVKFNPPVRFLQGQNHKDLVGVELDRSSLSIKFSGSESKKKLQHLIKKLVADPAKGLKATSSYKDVFSDYGTPAPPGPAPIPPSNPKLKPGALFNYPVTRHSSLLDQLAKEAKNLNCDVYPASGTFLIRSIIEALLKHIIDDQKADPQGKSQSLESAINLCLTPNVKLHADDKAILKEFKKSHLDYVNLGAHGNVIPNKLRLFSARDCVDMFVRRNI